MPKPSKDELELQRIAKNLLAMPHKDRSESKFDVRPKRTAKPKKKGKITFGLIFPDEEMPTFLRAIPNVLEASRFSFLPAFS